MNHRFLFPLLCFCLGLAAGLAGCEQRPSESGSAELQVVPVSQPVQRQITDYVEFTGQTDAVDAVDVRPRATGYLVSMPFKEGSTVKPGELLFEIDPRPYQAQLDQALAQVTLNKAQLELAQATLARDQALARQVAGGVSQQQLDQDLAAVSEAVARVAAYKASADLYLKNLTFTKVTSPIGGQISRYYLTVGNLAVQDQTLLTTVVSLDPMYAYFDMTDLTLLRIQTAINQGKIKQDEAGAKTPVFMGLEGEDGYPHQGTLNFINNQANPNTGTISVRGIFPNPASASGIRLLSPGMFARVRLPIGEPHKALLVIDRAIGSDQGLKYVYVVDAENKVHYRRVVTGALEPDGLRVIQPAEPGKEKEEGLKPDEWVVSGNLQQVRPQTIVQPERVTMPTLSQPAEPRVGRQGDKETRRQGDQKK